MDDLKREIEFTPAFDRRDPDPSKNYGIHGVEMRWYLTGPLGAIQFVVFTNWHLPHVQAELNAKTPSSNFPYLMHSPAPTDVGYHSPTPQYEGQETMGPCPHLGGAPCYYDGSGLRAEEWFKVLVESGSEAIWKLMEEEYRRLFVKPTAAEQTDG